LSKIADLTHPPVFGVPVRSDPIGILPRSLVSADESPSAIVTRCMPDDTYVYSRFDGHRLVTDRSIDGQTQ